MHIRFGAVVVLLCFSVIGVGAGVAQAPAGVLDFAGAPANFGDSQSGAGDYHLTLVSAGGQYGGGQTTITCSSNDGKRNYCGKYYPNQVSLSKQISGSPCIQGRTWGVDGNGLWVDQGCRANFLISGNPGGGGPGGPGWWNPNPGDTWPPKGDWHGGNWGKGGACFYKSSNFGGDYFCMRRGEQNSSLTGGYGDQVSSIRIFGGARVFIYDDRNFSGPRLILTNDAPDLKRYSVAGKPGHSWNNRINSVRIQ